MYRTRLYVLTLATLASPAEIPGQNTAGLASRSADTRPASRPRSQTSARAEPASGAGGGGRGGVGPLLCWARAFAGLLQIKFAA